jgi:hypothetical protein
MQQCLRHSPVALGSVALSSVAGDESQGGTDLSRFPKEHVQTNPGLNWQPIPANGRASLGSTVFFLHVLSSAR